MESAVKQRLVQFIKIMHLTQRAFEQRCGMSNGYVANIRKGIGEDYLLNIAQQFPQLNRAWLLFGEGEMLKNATAPIIKGDITITDVNNSSISNVGHGNTYNSCNASTPCRCALYPVLPKEVIRALDTNIEKWKEQNLDKCKVVDLRELIGEVSHAQYMIGRAMEPNIPEGTLLFLREINEWDEALLDGSIYGIDVARPHMIIRKVYDDGEFIRCQPTNPEFDAVRIPKEKVMNLYKISSGWKKFD